MTAREVIVSRSVIAADLRAAAEWIDAHPELPPIFSINAYEAHGVGISFTVATDAEADALLALTLDDFWRSDHRYAEGESKSSASRIANGRMSERLSLSVAVSR